MLNEEEIQQLYKDGTKVKHIAEAYSLSKEAVYQRLRKLPDFKQIKQKLYTQSKRELLRTQLQEYAEYLPKVYKLREQGVGMVEISKRFSISYKFLRKLLKGTQYDGTRDYVAMRNQDIFHDYKDGMTQVEIAKKHNTTQPNVSNILHRHFEQEL